MTQAVKKEDSVVVKAQVLTVPLTMVEPTPGQPREEWVDEEVDQIARDLKEHGQIEPIIVIKKPGRQKKGVARWRIVSGETRYRASIKAGLDTIDVVEREDLDERNEFALAVRANVHQRGLTHIEQAHAGRRLVDELGFSVEEATKILGLRSISTFESRMRLNSLPEEIQAMMGKNVPEDDRLGSTVTLAFVGVPEDRAVRYARRAQAEGWSAKKAREVVRIDFLETGERRKGVRGRRPDDDRAVIYGELGRIEKVLGDMIDRKLVLYRRAFEAKSQRDRAQRLAELNVLVTNRIPDIMIRFGELRETLEQLHGELSS